MASDIGRSWPCQHRR